MSRYLAMSLMSLGFFPLFTRCQLFGVPIPGNYPPPGPPNPYGYFSNYGPPGSPGFAYPGINSDGPSDSNVVLPKLPEKYESAVVQYRSGPRYNEKPVGYPGYPGEDMAAPPSPDGPLYPDMYGSSYPRNYFENDVARYKTVYPKKSFDGQTYGSYTEFLKALLSGRPMTSVPAMHPSYTQDTPRFKSALGNDYSGLVSKYPPFRVGKGEFDFGTYDATVQQQGPDPNRPPFGYNPTGVLYTEKPPQSPPSPPPPPPEQQQQQQQQQQRDIYQQFERKTKPVFTSYMDFPPTGRNQPGFANRQDGPPEQHDLAIYVPPQHRPSSSGSGNPDFKPLYDNPFDGQFGERLPENNYPNNFMKPGPAYQGTYALPPPAGFDLTTYDIEPASSSQFGYEQMVDRQLARTADPRKDQHQQKYPIGATYNGYQQQTIKYPMLGTAADLDYKLQPVPAVIAALFGGKKLHQAKQQQENRRNMDREMAPPLSSSSSRPQQQQQYFMQKYEFDLPTRERPPAQYSTPTIPTYGGGSGSGQGSGRAYEHKMASQQDVRALDIYIPVAPRPNKQLQADPLKTIVFPSSRGS